MNLHSNLGKLYGFVWGHCHTGLQACIKSLIDYKIKSSIVGVQTEYLQIVSSQFVCLVLVGNIVLINQLLGHHCRDLCLHENHQGLYPTTNYCCMQVVICRTSTGYEHLSMGCIEILAVIEEVRRRHQLGDPSC